MNEENISVIDTDPKRLAALMEENDERESLWSPSELQAVFRHQMSAPVHLDLTAERPGQAKKIKLLACSQGLLLNSFQDLFQHANPPVELLRLVKDFAKRSMVGKRSVLPQEIAKILYYASIVAALMRCQTRISSLSNADLRKGLIWALNKDWLDDDNRSLFQNALDHLNRSTGEAS